MENLAKAIIEVMTEVKGMEKNSRVGGNSSSAYDGTKYADVAERFNDAMTKNGLCIIPIDIEEQTQIDRWEEVDTYSKTTPQAMKTKQNVFTKVKTKYLLLHKSGESQIVAGYGHGVDPQDKGAGKATTYALKNALLYLFLTPVGKMDDTDKDHSNDLQVPKNPPANTPTPEPAKAPEKPVFNETHFQGAYDKKSTLEQIREKTVLTQAMEDKFIEFTINKDKENLTKK